MRHNVKKNRINRPKAARELLLGNLASSLIMHEKIKTTKAKAKALQPLIEKLVNTSKKENKMNAIRSVSKILHTEVSSKKLFDELAKKYQDRPSGYTRISELGFRAGDSAPLVQIELV
ncbi:50S ribosomal protein L17 [Candidatus Peregrinibacteria bacterium]|nr:50S ribosomal protein L17 [Candidatus Peregrinibacteria bacterium]